VAGSLYFQRCFFRPRSDSGLPPLSRDGADSGVSVCGWVRLVLASGFVSGPGAVGIDYGFRLVDLGRCRLGFGDAFIGEA